MPWTTPETFTAGQTLTAASMNIVSDDLRHLYDNLPKGRLGSESSTSISQSTSSSGLDLTGMTVTFTAEASRWYKVELLVPRLAKPASTQAHLSINEGATILNRIFFDSATVADYVQGAYVMYVAQFSAGSHTVKGVFGTAGGVGSVTAQSNGYRVTIAVYDLGTGAA
jgi:hypothetical protein